MPTKFEFDNLDLAPEGAGIYAWYMRPELRLADLSDKDLTINNLFRLAKQLSLPGFEVEARGHLSLSLKGRLDHVCLAPENSPGFTSSVESILDNDKKRELFAKILNTATPNFMSPLYIGVTINIRQRLRQHRQDIENFRIMQRSGFGDSAIDNAKQKFALEIVKRGIPSRRLQVYVSSGFDSNSDPEAERETAEAVETILNRLFYPILGRR
ncbi:MAG: hypothetical protein ACYC9T_09365 [Trichloromonadaceae bacterium]